MPRARKASFKELAAQYPKSGKYVPGSGPVNAKLMVIGEAPGEEEERDGETLVGPTGRLVDEMLKDAGMGHGLRECYKTNICKIRPPGNNLKMLHMLGYTIEDFEEQLWGEIAEINPNCILALGAVALERLTDKKGIGKWRGSILKSRKGYPKLVSTYHPAGLLRRRGPGSLPYGHRAFMHLDFARAIEESSHKELKLPKRLLQICRTSRQLFEFIRTYRSQGKTLLSVDIEAHRGIPSCIGISFNSYHGLSVPLVNLYGTTYIADAEMNDIWRQMAELLGDPEIEIIGQNFKYDQQKLAKPMGMPCTARWDTSLIAHAINPEFMKNLAFLTSIYTREPYYKDDGKEFDARKDSYEKIFIYNARDAVVTFEIFEELIKDAKDCGIGTDFLDYVMSLHDLYVHIESNGFAVDMAKRKALTDHYKERLIAECKEMYEILGRKFKYNHGPTVKKILVELGIPERQDTKEETLVALLANNVKDPTKRRFIELVLSARRVHKTLSTYLMQFTDGDGRMRTTFQIAGTENGRTSTNILKPPVRPFQCGLAFQTLTKHGDIGAEIRSILIADPGHVVMESDLSQAEARIVATLADDQETLRLFNTTDIHRLTAGWCFGLTPEQSMNMDKEDPRRFVGKTVRHAGNYGMGKHRLMLEIMTGAKKYNIPIGPPYFDRAGSVSEREANRILQTFHRKTPRIKNTFHASVFAAIRKDRSLRNPYDRVRRFFGRFDDDLLKEAYAMIPQSTVKDHLNRGMLDFRKRHPDVKIVGEAHDAFTVMCPDNQIQEVGSTIKELLERPIDFTKCSIPRDVQLVIPAGVEIGPNYLELSPVNV